ncbi:DUF533 domain-containing protein [Methylobacterium durans]|uniref:DUF533 domain-containing protein n=1 Tax=Methylobacterium durans TaxID=2202825 RepID=A0A2U8W148_9HYPH|nr:DUF533 domain-containing protein [Methylobacterium durans]AWN39809.1 hypothetical protein DK389_03735 [Methylobacterium durans]
MFGERIQSLFRSAAPPEMEPPPTPSRGVPGGRRPDARTALIGSLGQKVLHAWLQNRHQTLVPLTLDLRSLKPEERLLVLRVVAASVAASGRAPDLGLADAALERIGAGDDGRRVLRELLERGDGPAPFAEVQAAGLGTVAYGASLLAIDQRSRINQLYLAYLAARLAVSDDAASSLHRRYRM